MILNWIFTIAFSMLMAVKWRSAATVGACFARFVRLKGLTNKRDIRVSTANGRMVLTVTDDDLVRVNMGEPNFEPSAVPFRANKAEKTYIMRAAEQTILCGVVSMGNPHCVIQVDDVDTAAVRTLGPVLESHERFPERANIGFMQVVKREHYWFTRL